MNDQFQKQIEESKKKELKKQTELAQKKQVLILKSNVLEKEKEILVKKLQKLKDQIDKTSEQFNLTQSQLICLDVNIKKSKSVISSSNTLLNWQEFKTMMKNALNGVC